MHRLFVLEIVLYGFPNLAGVKRVSYLVVLRFNKAQGFKF